MSEIYAIPQAGSTWQHRDGTEYVVIDCTSQPDAEKADRFPMTVFYRGPDGRKWARTLDSWRASFVLTDIVDAEFIEPGTENDGALFRFWIRMAAEKPGRVASALIHCIRPEDYRDSLTRLMESSKA